jgi:hypothetical protein
MLKPDKKTPLPLLYHLGFIVGLVDEVPPNNGFPRASILLMEEGVHDTASPLAK